MLLSGQNEVHAEGLRKTLASGAREDAADVVVVAAAGGASAVVGEVESRLAGKGPTAGLSSLASLKEKQCWRQFSLAVTACATVSVLFVLYTWHKTLPSARDPATGKIREFTFPYFVLCFIGGGIAGLAHVLVTPIDVVKCRMQVGECASMMAGFRDIFANAKGSCVRAVPLLFRGWLPTLVAYVTQGSLKFGLYEVLKCVSSMAWLDSNSTALHKLVSYLLSSALAEIVADLGLAPFETVKIKVQTTNTYPTDLRTIIPRIWAAEGWNGFYKGLVPLWFRQVPYTMVKFVSFEGIVNMLNTALLSPDKPPSQAAQLAITMLAGVLAGFLCAVVSHPADTLVSKMNQRAGVRREVSVSVASMASEEGGPGDAADMGSVLVSTLHGGSGATSVMGLVRELGWPGLWRGLLPRLAMVGFMTSLQWLAYDAFKVAVGLPTTGGGGGGSGADTALSQGLAGGKPGGR